MRDCVEGIVEGVEGGEQWPEVGEGAGFFQAAESAARGKVSEDVEGEGGQQTAGEKPSGEAKRRGEAEEAAEMAETTAW